MKRGTVFSFGCAVSGFKSISVFYIVLSANLWSDFFYFYIITITPENVNYHGWIMLNTIHQIAPDIRNINAKMHEERSRASSSLCRGFMSVFPSFWQEPRPTWFSFGHYPLCSTSSLQENPLSCLNRTSKTQGFVFPHPGHVQFTWCCVNYKSFTTSLIHKCSFLNLSPALSSSLSFSLSLCLFLTLPLSHC